MASSMHPMKSVFRRYLDTSIHTATSNVTCLLSINKYQARNSLITGNYFMLMSAIPTWNNPFHLLPTAPLLCTMRVNKYACWQVSKYLKCFPCYFKLQQSTMSGKCFCQGINKAKHHDWYQAISEIQPPIF